MVIDIWYDPVYRETRVCIDGYWQNTSDIYGFLYPVLHYPLQTWLSENGSWGGLYKQLTELARGENVQLIFHGRINDYHDIASTLAGKSEITVSYSGWNIEEQYQERLSEVKNLLSQVDTQNSGYDFVCPLFESDGVKLTDWCYEIHSENMFGEALKSELPCVFIHECVISSFDRLSYAEKLTRSLQRPSEAVFSIIGDPVRRGEIARYCSLFPNMNFQFFADRKDPDFERLYLKYGKPYVLKNQLSVMKDTIHQLNDMIMEDPIIRKQIQDIIHEDQQNQSADVVILNKLRRKHQWITKNEKMIRKLSEIVLSHAADFLEGR